MKPYRWPASWAGWCVLPSPRGAPRAIQRHLKTHKRKDTTMSKESDEGNIQGEPLNVATLSEMAEYLTNLKRGLKPAIDAIQSAEHKQFTSIRRAMQESLTRWASLTVGRMVPTTDTIMHMLNSADKANKEALFKRLAKANGDVDRKIDDIVQKVTALEKQYKWLVVKEDAAFTAVAAKCQEVRTGYDMTDEEFAKMRSNALRIKSVRSRMVALVTLVDVLRRTILEKRSRLESLRNRIKSEGRVTDGKNFEVLTAEVLAEKLVKSIETAERRRREVLADFAKVRKQLILLILQLTTKIDDMAKNKDPGVQDAFTRSGTDASNAIRLLQEMNERMTGKRNGGV